MSSPPTSLETQRSPRLARLRTAVIAAALGVLAICIYSFLQGNNVFKGQFDNDAIAFYFLAKGIFCSLALYLLYLVVEALAGRSVNI